MDKKDKNKNSRALGVVFLSLGITFFAIGIANRQNAFGAMGTTFFILGIVFLAQSKSKNQPK